MSDATQEQFQQSLLDQHARWNAYAAAALDGAVKLFELNLQVIKQSLSDTSRTFQETLHADSPADVFNVDQNLLRERIEQVTAYAQEVGAIVTGFAGDVFALPTEVAATHSPAPARNAGTRAAPKVAARAPARRASTTRTTAAKTRSRK